MCGEQWHGPGVGVIPELARVARQQLTELGIRQGRRRARTTGSFAISQRRWRSFGKIPLDPAIDRAAFYTRMLGNDGNRRTFCNLGNCPKAPIKSGVVRLLKRLQQASTLRPTERRIARSGCVHPDTIGSARACRKTSGNLLRTYPASLEMPALDIAAGVSMLQRRIGERAYVVCRHQDYRCDPHAGRAGRLCGPWRGAGRARISDDLPARPDRRDLWYPAAIGILGARGKHTRARGPAYSSASMSFARLSGFAVGA